MRQELNGIHTLHSYDYRAMQTDYAQNRNMPDGKLPVHWKRFRTAKTLQDIQIIMKTPIILTDVSEASFQKR